jgi:putative transposase
LYEVSAHIAQSALKDLNSAFERFFERLSGERGPRYGYPRFKRKGKRDTARLYAVTFEERHIRKIGRVRLKETRSKRGFQGRILSATISRRANRWFVSLVLEREREVVLPRPVVKLADLAGVDLGLKSTAVIHDGVDTRVVEPRRALRRNLRKLSRLNRQLAGKQRGSRNREKAKQKLARLHYRIACLRRDQLHQLSSSLAKTKSVIVLDDLNVRGIRRNRRLGLAVWDAGLGELRRQLTYKAEWYGANLVIADRFYPSSKTCSRCGVVKDVLTISERVFNCSACGVSLDRDENAAINLRRLGLSATELPEGLREVTPVERKALASALPDEVKPASAKQEATASDSPRATRRSTSKGVLVRG